MADRRKVIAAKLNEEGSAGETKICVRCRRMFTYLGYGHFYCPECKRIDEIDFARVKEYIYENGIASSNEVSEKTGVSLERITQYLREGRLEIPEMSPIFIKCEMCSTDIRSGRLCPSCAAKLSHAMRVTMEFDDEQIGQLPKHNTKKMDGKMRFLDHKNNQ